MVLKALSGAFVALLLAAAAAQAAPARLAVPVFAYHLVDSHIPADPIGNALTVTPAQLEAELKYLQAHRIRAITAQEFAERLARGEALDHVAVLTFDDGYLDARTEALPLLQRYGAKATFYVVAHTIGTPRHLGWADIRALLAAGMEIGAHGTDHLDLSQMTPKEQQFQVLHCIETIARYTGVRPRTYAYPSGQYDSETLAVMKAAGIEAAFTMRYGLVHSLARPYELPRVRIERTTAEETFESALAAAR